jgi:PAS domain S-box-containing protein
MIRKLDSLSRATQVALQYLSCLGNVASIATLSLVLDDSPEQVASALEPAVYHDLVELQGENYKFTHDRVQEAAYAQLELGARERLHRKIGWLLVASTAANDSNDAIFDIANQLNNAVSVIDEPDECIRLARINLQAGQRAKSLAAYSTALDYFNRGALLLELSHEKATGDLTVALALGQGECELLTGNLIEAERRLTALPSTSFTVEQRSTVTCLLADINMARNDSPKAVELTLKFLRTVGINWSAHPDEDELKSEYEHVKSLIGCRTIETLIDLHPIRDSVALATVSVLGKLLPIALVTDRNLTALTACRAVAISLTYGHTDGSCNAYQYLCAMAARYFGDHELAARFGKLGYELVERRGLGDFAAHTYLAYAIGTLRWTEHVNASSAMLRKSWQAADRAGDFINALYAQQNLVSDQLFAGKSLIEVQQDAESSLAYARRFDFRHAIDNLGNQLALVNNLRGRTVAFGSFETETFSELETEQYLENSPGLAMSAFWYWVRKLQARYLAGNYDAAHTALINACRFEWAWPGPFEQAELHFYSALTHAALSDFPTAMRSHHLQETSRNFDLHSVWAELSPANFSARHSLVAAEIARLEGRDIQAMKLYEKSIREAQKSGFVHVEALANEHAAHFYAQGDFSFIANAYLRAAVHCFRRWGAEGKVKHFQKLHPDLFSLNESPLQSPQMMSAEQLDLATVIKLSQAVSSEIVLDKLIDTLMKTVLEQAGANRGVLILGREGNFEIFSEAKLVGNQTSVSLDRKEMTPHLVPATLVARAQRKLEVVISGDAIRDPDVSDDSYVRRRNSRSILCLPLLNQSRLAGIIYLENDFVAHLFTADRLALLRLVASQAAIAIDNAQLYLDLANREAKIRRLVEANIIGIMISDSCGNIVEANEAFLQIIGYERSDIERLKMSVRALQSKEPLGNNGSEHKLSDARTSVPYEAQYIRKDGQTVSVLIGSAVLDIASGESVSFVLDLSDRKRAEHYARESEKRLRDVQSELAHANRVATMGQLTASIAHEVNQPISATLINAEAALRWLNTPTPNLEEAKEALRRIANDGLRAGDVIGRIRAQLKRLPPQKENVSLGDSIADVLLLVNGQAEKHGVTIIVELADEAPLYAFCDRVQLQQVLLNLVLNAVEAISGEDVNFKRTVTISAALTENGFAGVRVADTGPGLTPEAVDRVFNPFVSSKPSGMGMGLSICRSIVESHGGQLSASLNKPRGTIFQFSVPVGTPNA